MSAIWGKIDLFRESDHKALAARMKNSYAAYKIDIIKQYVASDSVIGYGGQFFTKEAENEILPIIDNDEKVYFVADVILDNRDELFDLLEEKKEMRNHIPDGTLMYRILRKFGKESFSLFLGTYSFVYYDKNKREIYLVCDAVGSRSLYYYFDQGVLYFSTLIKPIFNARNIEIKWNYRFLSDYLALDNLAVFSDPEETPYQNLYKIASGQAVIITGEKIVKEEYWKPAANIKRVKKSDSEIKSEFIRLFDTCVKDLLRSSGKTGILLSGGLDSTSVACFAAPKLKEKNELLYSYTSIPEEGYISTESTYYITNERKAVEITKSFLGNLSCSFLDLPGVNGYDGAEKFMERMELPYKALQNIKWMQALAEKAADDGCRILLTGQCGNATISYGDYKIHFYSLFCSGRFIELMKEINTFHKNHSYGRKKIYRDIITQWIRFLTRKMITIPEMFSDVYVNPELISCYDTGRRFKRGDYYINSGYILSDRTIRKYMANKIALRQIGEFETRLSLSSGIIFRDPTKDKRIIEFCMKLPENQFVYRGVSRRLVREYLKDFIPEGIRSDYNHRGLQSADALWRIQRNWGNIYKECLELLNTDDARKLLDIPKIKEKLDSYKNGITSGDQFEITKMLYSILLIKYVNA